MRGKTHKDEGDLHVLLSTAKFSCAARITQGLRTANSANAVLANTNSVLVLTVSTAKKKNDHCPLTKKKSH